ncbi:MAG: helix-turn-helix transcriptional regulator [Saprospiraceae bacterium]|nr:helix-turn-helix transcriptional regulator [Saprospiraceae bacterium]
MSGKIKGRTLFITRHLFLMQTGSPHYAQLLRARNYILNNLDKQLLNKDIAKVAHISLYHFHRLFSDTFGITPAKYIRNKRMEEAKLLLVRHQKSVSEVASQVGYADVYTFSKTFKREVGLPPSEYRDKDFQVLL